MGRLTFELSGDRRLGAAAKLGKMGRSPSPAWTTCQAVGRPLERGVRRHRVGAEFGIRLPSAFGSIRNSASDGKLLDRLRSVE